MVLLALALGGLGLRLAWLQLIEGTRLEARARRVQTETRNPLGRRRTIVDRRGRLLAIDEERVTVWAHPRYFRYFRFPGDEPSIRRSTTEVSAPSTAACGAPSSAARPAIAFSRAMRCT